MVTIIPSPPDTSPGYCELYNNNYQDRQTHVTRDATHLRLAQDPATWAEFDKWPEKKAEFDRQRADQAKRMYTQLSALLCSDLVPSLVEPYYGDIRMTQLRAVWPTWADALAPIVARKRDRLPPSEFAKYAHLYTYAADAAAAAAEDGEYDEDDDEYDDEDEEADGFAADAGGPAAASRGAARTAPAAAAATAAAGLMLPPPPRPATGHARSGSMASASASASAAMPPPPMMSTYNRQQLPPRGMTAAATVLHPQGPTGAAAAGVLPSPLVPSPSPLPAPATLDTATCRI